MAFMKKTTFPIVKAFALAAIIITTACNSGETSTTTSDTSVTNDSIPGVVNPGQGDTSNATVEPPTTNDNNAIMPDSTTVSQ
jgi:hypothetical protein